MASEKQPTSNMTTPPGADPSSPRRQLFGLSPFIASGSIWFALLGLILEFLAWHSHYAGWETVEQRGGKRVERLVLSVNESNWGGEIDTMKVILWLAFGIAAFGCVLGLLGLSIGFRKPLWSLIGLTMNGLALLIPWLIQK